MENNELAKKVGQLLVIGFEGITVPDEIREMIHTYHVGSIILFGRNIGTPKEVLALTTELQGEAKKAGYKHPLLICVDQENGVVRRLGEGATILPGAMTLGASDEPKYAYDIGVLTGKELKSLGINWNLAPVLDVNNNPDNPVIGVRSFGESSEKVAQFGRATMQGMQDASIATTLKHFPGHGDTDVDSHLDLPVISHSVDRLEDIELKPFKACIHAEADTVMTAHVYFPSMEPEPEVPATISHNVITGLLREKLGFNGVVTTDCMEMNAILHGVGTERGAVEALKAGVDFIMISHTLSRQKGAIDALLRAVENSEVDEAEIDQAIERINKLKEKYTNWNELALEESLDVPELVGSDEHKKVAYDIYKQSVTMVKNDGILPFSTEKRVLVIHPDDGTTMQVEDKRYASLSLGKFIQDHVPEAVIHQLSQSFTDKDTNTIVEEVTQFDIAIVGTLTITPENQQITLVEKLVQAGIPVVVIAMRSPYDLGFLPEVSAYLNTYEFTEPALQVAAATLFGKEDISGKLPVTIKERK